MRWGFRDSGLPPETETGSAANLGPVRAPAQPMILPAACEADSVTTLKITEHLLDAMYELPGTAAGQAPGTPATP